MNNPCYCIVLVLNFQGNEETDSAFNYYNYI